MSPKHSIDYCPICGGGLCGIRICGLPTDQNDKDDPNITPHGLIICDECDAIWLEPNTSTDHQYPDPEIAACPICSQPLWGHQSRWASANDIDSLGWTSAVDTELDILSDEEMV